MYVNAVKKAVTGAIALLAAMILLTACSAHGGRPIAKEGESSGEGAGTPRIKVAMITHAAAGDTFWDIVRKGAEEDSKKNNVELLYSSDPDGGKQAQLVDSAIEQNVQGIIVTLSKPDAMKASVEKAVKAGIPVVSINSGEDIWKSLGIITHFGQNDELAGEALGNRMKADGLSSPICVIHEQGNVGLESRCAGVKKILPQSETLYVQGTDMTQVKATVSSKLQASKADSIIGLGAPYTLTAASAVKETSSQAKVYSFDLNADLAKAIDGGTVVATVDQQPYLQGYQAVDAIWAYHRGGFREGGGQQVFTGPAIVDKSNAGDVAKYAAEGIR